MTASMASYGNTSLALCEHGEDEDWEPGFAEVLNHPGCKALKALLILIGALGLYVTRSLYGASTVHSAQFQRAK